MDLHSIETYLRPTDWAELTAWQPDWAWLAGGTWLFSEPQPQVRTLVDLQALGWSELAIAADGLTIGATCTMRQLLQADYPAVWLGIEALRNAVRELASFKIHNEATIAGNLCLALPAGTFAPALVALDARYEVWPHGGEPYWLPASAFQLGARQTVLQPGDLLRRIHVPAAALAWQTSYQRLCVATAGIALAIAVAAYHPATQTVRLVAGASFPQPRQWEFFAPLCREQITTALAALPLTDFIADAAASAVYRRQVLGVLLVRSLSDLGLLSEFEPISIHS
ncbi:MAG: carbon monoxide dehydrogenase [Spirulinaceae cyanobacterium RM2_2_10]|nr:carbon monoxide dehydrogenase [Spirulinaceae cyanobacterium SM2_1_0]NJO21269.1 carbon monoxide dehydrogenase [Spirulinaceae cyanobacterium RM2_2_10]